MSTPLTKLEYVPPVPKRPELFVDDAGKRLDNRGKEVFRHPFMKTGVINQAVGSAYIESENTKIICGVYGPRQTAKIQYSEKGKVQCDFKFASFANSARKKPQQSPEEKELSALMEQSLEPALQLSRYPRSVVDVFVVVLENDGNAFALGVLCASLALAHAGIEMYDLVSASSAVEVDGHLVLDPTCTEESWRGGQVTVVSMPSMNEVTQVVQSGELKPETVAEGIELCMEGGRKMHTIMREVLLSGQQK